VARGSIREGCASSLSVSVDGFMGYLESLITVLERDWTEVVGGGHSLEVRHLVGRRIAKEVLKGALVISSINISTHRPVKKRKRGWGVVT